MADSSDDSPRGSATGGLSHCPRLFQLESRFGIEYKGSGLAMERRFHWRFVVGSCAAILAASLLCPTIRSAQTETQNPPAASSGQDQPDAKEKKETKSSNSSTTKLRILVTGNDDKPISNASVYVRFYTSGGFLHHEKLAEMNFKTNLDGSVKVPELPKGRILIQVIANGWHTYGKWYDVETDEESITVKLEPPPHWY